MKRHCFISYPLFALIGLILSPLAVVHASPSTADNVHFCLPFDYEQWQRDHPLPAGKRLADRNAGEPRTVRMIYFLPNDRPHRQGVVDEMKTMMRRVQTFYAEQMQAHGYGNTTFRFETDAQGEPLVHRVDGQHPDRHYNENETMGEVIDEIYFGEGPLQFDVLANDYLIVIDNSTGTIDVDGYKAGGVNNDLGKRGGITLVPSDLHFGIVAHELGHTFGLWHDFRDDAYIMSYGGNPDRLSACAAEFLSVHPYFNADISLGGEVDLDEDHFFGQGGFGNESTIEMISPSDYPSGSTSVSVRFKVSDTEGLHQVLLLDTEREADGDAAGLTGLAACRGLNGEQDAVVEFEYDVSIPPFRRDPSEPEAYNLYVQVVDADGEVTDRSFGLVEASSYHIATLNHQNYIRSVSFSPDGTLLATSEELIPTVRLWDAASRQQVATLELEDWSTALSFSPDGTLLAIAEAGPGLGGISLWDVASRQQVATLQPGGWDFRSLSFSSDGTLLAVGAAGGGEVSLWDVASRELVAILQPSIVVNGEGRSSVESVALSPDGTLLATAWRTEGSDFTISLWDVASRQKVGTLQPRSGYIGEVLFSPDGTLLAVEGDINQLWDVATRQEVALELESWGNASAFSPDGTLLAIGANGPSRLWDVASGQLVATFVHPGGISDMSFSPDGTLLATGGSGGTVWLWDVSEWTGEGTIATGEQAMPQTLTKVSGDGQEGTVGAALARPFVVSVLDQEGAAFAGAVVRFSVTAGGGTLSSTTTTTDANGRARSTLTLGSDPGTNTVKATVEGLEPETFTATATADSEETTDSEDQQESEEQPTTTVELEGISSSHDSVREDDEQATVITLTVTLDEAAAADETITLAIVSSTQGKTAKRGEDFDATLGSTLTIAKGQTKGTAQLTLTPKDNTTADGDKAFAVQATSSSGHSALINIKIIDNDLAVESQAWLTPDPSEVAFDADDPAWKTFTVHTNLDSVLVRANPSGSDPAIEVAGGQQVPTRDYCPAEGNDRPSRGRRDGWSLHVKACQAGQTKILLIDYDTGEVVQQYEVNVEASTSAAATTALNPSYPNPFNSETVLSYTLPTASDIRLEVFTLNGQRVAVLYEGLQAAGYHTIAMDASDWASGVYLYRLTTPEGRFVQKFTLLR